MTPLLARSKLHEGKYFLFLLGWLAGWRDGRTGGRGIEGRRMDNWTGEGREELTGHSFIHLSMYRRIFHDNPAQSRREKC